MSFSQISNITSWKIHDITVAKTKFSNVTTHMLHISVCHFDARMKKWSLFYIPTIMEQYHVLWIPNFEIWKLGNFDILTYECLNICSNLSFHPCIQMTNGYVQNVRTDIYKSRVFQLYIMHCQDWSVAFLKSQHFSKRMMFSNFRHEILKNGRCTVEKSKFLNVSTHILHISICHLDARMKRWIWAYI